MTGAANGGAGFLDPSIPDADLADLATVDGHTVRVGGLVTALEADGSASTMAPPSGGSSSQARQPRSSRSSSPGTRSTSSAGSEPDDGARQVTVTDPALIVLGSDPSALGQIDDAAAVGPTSSEPPAGAAAPRAAGFGDEVGRLPGAGAGLASPRHRRAVGPGDRPAATPQPPAAGRSRPQRESPPSPARRARPPQPGPRRRPLSVARAWVTLSDARPPCLTLARSRPSSPGVSRQHGTNVSEGEVWLNADTRVESPRDRRIAIPSKGTGMHTGLGPGDLAVLLPGDQDRTTRIAERLTWPRWSIGIGSSLRRRARIGGFASRSSRRASAPPTTSRSSSRRSSRSRTGPRSSESMCGALQPGDGPGRPGHQQRSDPPRIDHELLRPRRVPGGRPSRGDPRVHRGRGAARPSLPRRVDGDGSRVLRCARAADPAAAHPLP